MLIWGFILVFGRSESVDAAVFVARSSRSAGRRRLPGGGILGLFWGVPRGRGAKMGAGRVDPQKVRPEAAERRRWRSRCL